MYDLMAELLRKVSILDESIESLKESGIDYANSEKNYKIILRQECLKLRDQGMAIGMIDKVCYGIPSVAEARFKRDVADAMYKADLESINAVKLEIRLLEGQINREWEKA